MKTVGLADRDQILDRMPIAYVANDLDFRVIDWNPAAEATFGYTRAEALGKTPYELFLPEGVHAYVRAVHARLLAGEMTAHGQNECLTKDGRTVVCEWHNTPLRGDDGAVVGSLSMAIDVTERVRSERALRENEGRLRLLATLDAATQPLADPDAITAASALVMGEHLGADRCAYGEAEVHDGEISFHVIGNYNRGVPSMVGCYELSKFGTEVSRCFLANEPCVTDDVVTDPRFAEAADAYLNVQIRAMITIPLHKAGRFVAAMAVHQATPRAWTAEEIELVRLVAARCWEAIERARVARSLRQSEGQYRYLAEGLGEFLWSSLPDGRSEFVNRFWREYTGLSQEETGGDGWSRVVHPDDVAPLQERVAAGQALGEGYEFEYRVRRASDGMYRWFLGRSMPIRDGDGRVYKWVGSGVDIHDRKVAAGRQRLLAEAGRILGSSLDYEATLAQVSKLVVPLFSDWCALDLLADDGGVRRLSVVHKDPAKLELADAFRRRYPPRPDDAGGLMMVLRTGEPILHKVLTDDQLVQGARDAEHLATIRALELRSFLIVPLTARGRTLGALTLAISETSRHFDEDDLALATEIGNRAALAVDNARLFSQGQEAARRREEALSLHRSVEEQLTLLVEASGSLSASLDLPSVLDAVLALSHRLVAADAYAVWRYDAASGRWGIAHGAGLSEEYTRTSIRVLDETPSMPTAPVIAEDVLALPMLGDREAAYAAEGIRSLLAVPLKVHGAVTGTLVFYYRAPHRVSEVEVRVATALANLAGSAVGTAELYGVLKANDRKKDEFLAMLAHELRNPLAAVGNAVSVLKMSDDPDDVAFARDVVGRQVRQLTRLIDDLLDVSRINSGKIRLRAESVDARTILDGAVVSVRPLIDERTHELITSYASEPLPIRADPTRIEQIAVNLLTNAAKYTESGGRIWLDARTEADQVVIRVRDDGIGIPPDRLPEMFELFAQGERSIARSEGGLGIGLTIVRKLAELHGGTVTATSAGTGKGSEFVVRLPLARRPEEAPATARPALGGPTTGSRILIVDDNADTAMALERLLKRMGNRVETVHDGPAAVVAAPGFRPQFVLLDIGLPGMDGYEVARRLKADAVCKAAVIIAISGYGQDEDRRRSRAAGFDHHLVKPVDLDALTSLIT